MNGQEVTTVDERLTTLSVTLGEQQHLVFDADQGSLHMVAWSCIACTVYAEEQDLTWTNGTGMTATIQVQASTSVNVVVESEQSETVTVMVVDDIVSSGVHSRPAPGAATPVSTVGLCATASVCLDTNTGTLASRIAPADEDEYLLSGHVESSVDEYRTVEVSAGDTMEWQWLAATSDIAVQIYEQTEAGEVLHDHVHNICLLYTSPSPRDATLSRMPSSA